LKGAGPLKPFAKNQDKQRRSGRVKIKGWAGGPTRENWSKGREKLWFGHWTSELPGPEKDGELSVQNSCHQ